MGDARVDGSGCGPVAGRARTLTPQAGGGRGAGRKRRFGHPAVRGWRGRAARGDQGGAGRRPQEGDASKGWTVPDQGRIAQAPATASRRLHRRRAATAAATRPLRSHDAPAETEASACSSSEQCAAIGRARDDGWWRRRRGGRQRRRQEAGRAAGRRDREREAQRAVGRRRGSGSSEGDAAGGGGAANPLSQPLHWRAPAVAGNPAVWPAGHWQVAPGQGGRNRGA